MSVDARLVPSDAGAGVPQELSLDRLRTIVQDSHVSFLFGAGTPSAFFSVLGDVETVLTELAGRSEPQAEKDLVRASLQALIFDKIIAPNTGLLENTKKAQELIASYSEFLRTMNRVLLRRRSSLLSKQVNLFTTNFDLAFEVSLEALGAEFSDGFSGKIRPKFDLNDYGTLRFRQGLRFENQSEMPTFNLYKLHGSAGWKVGEAEGDGALPIYFDGTLSGLQSVTKALDRARAGLLPIADPTVIDLDALMGAAAGATLSTEVTAFVEAFNELPVVNPDKQKFATTVLNETYYELIRRFANELEKENCVLFVHGFSFRDEHLRALVVRAARTNPTLQVIVFCYSAGSKAAYEALIPPSSVKNGNIAYLLPREVDGKQEHLSLDVVVGRFFAPLVPEQPRRPDQSVELKIAVVDDTANA